MKLTIIGHGYVGLVTAAVFADLGNTVWVIGRTKEKIEQLRAGKPTFYEPGLEELLKRNIVAGRLIFTLEYEPAIPSSEIVFICVGTPSKSNGEADLTGVLSVAGSIGKHIGSYTIVACKSTVPIGTNKKIKEILLKNSRVPGAKFDIASCPEFLREGTAISDTLHPDRIVIGTESDKARTILVDFHKTIDSRYVLTNIETAEMIKYASNSFLATKISFANMIANLSEKVGADAQMVLDGVGMDHRIGRSFLYPGVGYGGSCFPKDVKALITIGQQQKVDMGLLEEVEKINTLAVTMIVEKTVKLLGSKPSGKTVALLGLAFKPNTDDMREAPSLKIITLLLKRIPTLTVRVYDPIIDQIHYKPIGHVLYSVSPYEAVTGADSCVVITEWNEFRQLDLAKIKKLMKTPIMIDGRNIFEPVIMKKLGYIYQGVGRK